MGEHCISSEQALCRALACICQCCCEQWAGPAHGDPWVPHSSPREEDPAPRAAPRAFQKRELTKVPCACPWAGGVCPMSLCCPCPIPVPVPVPGLALPGLICSGCSALSGWAGTARSVLLWAVWHCQICPALCQSSLGLSHSRLIHLVNAERHRLPKAVWMYRSHIFTELF